VVRVAAAVAVEPVDTGLLRELLAAELLPSLH
jgi:hypothetical protein